MAVPAQGRISNRNSIRKQRFAFSNLVRGRIVPMTRRFDIAFLAVLLLIFPALLAAQSADTSHAKAIVAPATGGCSSLLANAAEGGGQASAAGGSAVHG